MTEYEPKTDEVAFLKEQIRYLMEEKRVALDALEQAATLGNFRSSLNQLERPDLILHETAERAEALAPFKTKAFYLVDEADSDFDLAYVDPPGQRDFIEDEMARAIAGGAFAWALGRNKPVPLSSEDGAEEFLLHALSTESRTRGMFVGVLGKPRENILDVELALMTILFRACAHALESFELYARIREMNRYLEGSVCRLEQSEGRLIRHREELEKLVAERTADLSKANELMRREIEERRRMEAELVAAKEEAEESAAFKTRFLANMSHELRTPMNGILGMLELTAMTRLTAEGREFVSIARESAKTMLGIVSDILDLSKIEAGKLELKPVAFNLRRELDAVFRVFEAEASKKRLDFETHVAKDLPENLVGDVLRLKQVLMNLLSNAVKFTEKGAVRVVVAESGRMEEDVMLRLEVVDTGIGIEPEKVDYVFEPFTQLDDDYAKQFQGTGLGLAITRELVDMLGGGVWVHSIRGEGSTFGFSARLSLPAAADLAAGAEATMAAPAVNGAQAPEGLSFLVAEDDKVNQIFIQRLLEKAGHHVTLAASGEQALRVLEAAGQGPKAPGFDVVLMDVQMPGMDGMTATKRIRESGKDWAGVPVVALTAYAMPKDRDRFLAAGMDEYVPKPVEMEDLMAAVVRALKARRERAE